MRNTDFYIKKFNLQPHPEGGFYSEVYRSEDNVIPVDQKRYQENTDAEKITRSASTSIYFLLNQENYSAWHVLKSDEIWHFYSGSALKIHTINEAGELTTCILGNPIETEGASFQVVLKAGIWFAAEVSDKTSFGLVGCTVSPGFDFADFKLANRSELAAQYLQHEEIINRLCVAEKNILVSGLTTAGKFRPGTPLETETPQQKNPLCAL